MFRVKQPCRIGIAPEKGSTRDAVIGHRNLMCIGCTGTQTNQYKPVDPFLGLQLVKCRAHVFNDPVLVIACAVHSSAVTYARKVKPENTVTIICQPPCKTNRQPKRADVMKYPRIEDNHTGCPLRALVLIRFGEYTNQVSGSAECYNPFFHYSLDVNALPRRLIISPAINAFSICLHSSHSPAEEAS